MTDRRVLLKSAAAITVALSAGAAIAAPVAPSKSQILTTMKKATKFMVEDVATEGGYVWSILPDKSRRWGEMEAFSSMIWIQPPGTGTMGHIFLDAYHATGDEYYYQAATKVADALIKVQQPEGGWHYFGDLAGPESIKKWYDTIGKNAWRLEEFQHYWGNSTFDDAGTSEAMQFLLRLYVEKKDARFKPALDKAINFVLESQYPIGGWPQRYPLKHEYSHHGKPDYTSFITFNDDVAGENIRFLIMVWQALGDERVLDAITRAMSVFIVTQQGQPQPGWGLQYTLDLKPVGARTYEPTALTSHTTVSNIKQLMEFYKLTGETKYLSRIPEALDWLEAQKLPDEGGKTNRYPTFIEIGTGKPLYIHRKGSNIVNGEYYADYNPANTIIHYSSVRVLDIAKLRKDYEKLKATPPEVVSKDSPLKVKTPLDRYFMVSVDAGSDLNTGKKDAKPAELIKSLNKQGWWETPLNATSNPPAGDGSPTPAPGDFSRTRVGDATDTSPYITDKPVIGISTGTYVENMATLIGALEKTKK
jgi:PelA/Pel-15E family pectate lyase